MSDETTEDTLDVSAMSQAQLREHYANLSTAIETLEGDELTIETGEAIRALKVERNSVATAVNNIVALSADLVEDVPLADTDASETIIEALTDDAADASADAPDADADVDTTVVAEAPTVADLPTAETLAEQAETIVADAPAPVETVAETTIVHDVITPNTEEPTVAEAPDPNTPTAADTAALVAEAQAIVESAPVPVTAGLNDRPTDGGTAVIERPKVSYQAGAGQSEFAQNTIIGFDELGQAIRSVQLSGRASADGSRTSGVVASIPSFEATPGMPTEILSTRDGAVHSTALIDETVEAWKRARTAAANGTTVDAVTAAICTPLDIVRDVPECGVTDTPFADSFPQRGVGRGGFQYFPAMALIDTADNVNIWTEADQDAIAEATPSTWKPSPLIECATATSVTAEELVASATVDNSTNMSQPEQVVQFMHKMAVMRSRVREQYLLGKFDATASAYTHTGDYGALAALSSVILELTPRLTYGERLDEGDYDLVLEPGHFQKLLVDENSRIFGNSLESRKAGIIAKLKDEGGFGKVTILRDFRTGLATTFGTLRTPGSSAIALPRLFDANRVRFVPAGAYIFGATGEEATGWETDPQLHRMNRMQWFSKEWLLLAKHGCHPAATVDLVSCGSGARANGITPVDCTGQTS